MDKNYNAAQIEILENIEPVRRRPGMYTDTSNPNHLAREVIDNSIDEALAGFANKIEVILHQDNKITVSDNGRGMPIDKHPKAKIAVVELIMTKLHTGAKFSNKSYKWSGGLHGVGISVVNALSSSLDAEIMRDGFSWHISFANGECIKKLRKGKKLASKKTTGTKITFTPDPKFFDSPSFDKLKLQQVLQTKAILCPGLAISLTLPDNSLHEYCYSSGMSDYMRHALLGEESLPVDFFVDSYAGDNEDVDWLFCWAANRCVNESYVNLIPTPDGGTHVQGLRIGVTEAVREYTKLHNLLPKNLKLTADDVTQNLQFLLSLKMKEPQFAGQTKQKLTSREVSSFVQGVVQDSFGIYLNKHKKLALQLVMQFIDNAKQRLQKSQKVVRKKWQQKTPLPGKLFDCSSNDIDSNELFIVEGNSAGGVTVNARYNNYQAVLPLRGKILNTWELSHKQILGSAEIENILQAIGLQPGSDDLSGLRYGKICMLADADSDGQHITTLLCALFLKHTPELIIKGHLYAACPPLFRIDCGKQVFYAQDEAEKKGIIERLLAENVKGQRTVQRFKGLGEMNAIQLRQTVMDPGTRHLIQLNISDMQDAINNFNLLLAKKSVAARKHWLQTEGDRSIFANKLQESDD